MPERAAKYLAEKWVTEYGASAPAQVRQWAAEFGHGSADAEFFEQIARLAESLLAEWADTRANSSAAADNPERCLIFGKRGS